MRRAGAIAALAALAGCEAGPGFPAWLFDARTPRERYVARLEHAGLTATAVGGDWLAAAERALRDAPAVTPPHAEEGYLHPAEPAALAVRVEARRGQEVVLALELHGDTATALFLDAWEATGDSVRPFRHLASADSGERSLAFTPRRDGSLLLRAQPELLRGGRFTLRVEVRPTLAFPVPGVSETSVGSPFGAPRDGGVRSHHGIDIFAPRGAAVVAAAPGVVTRVETTERGGNVVWVRDRRGNALYYAHLDRQAVAEGARVETGDTVGFVGNTGNARRTPPHLHFGVYRRGEGPLDPWWFVRRPRGRVPRLVADTAHLGEWVRIRTDSAALREAPADRAAARRAVPRHTAVRVLAAVGAWYRVRLPDGASGFLIARAVETPRPAALAAGGRQQVLARPAAPAAPGEVIAQVLPGDSVAVLGRFGDYSLVRVGDGLTGWMPR